MLNTSAIETPSFLHFSLSTSTWYPGVRAVKNENTWLSSGRLFAAITNEFTTFSNCFIESVLSCCSNSKVNPPVAPKPGIAGGEMTTTFALLSEANFLCSVAINEFNWSFLSFLSSHGFNIMNTVPLFDLVANVTTFNPPRAAK